MQCRAPGRKGEAFLRRIPVFGSLGLRRYYILASLKFSSVLRELEVLHGPTSDMHGKDGWSSDHKIALELCMYVWMHDMDDQLGWSLDANQ